MNPSEYGLVEIIPGKYFDKKMNQNLILKQNYVEASGDEFKKNIVGMILYSYEKGKDRTETSEAFVLYAEENLDLIERADKQQELLKDEAIETTGAVVPGNVGGDNVPVILDTEQKEFRQ